MAKELRWGGGGEEGESSLEGRQWGVWVSAAATGHAGRGAVEDGMAGNSPQQDTYWKGVSGRRREGGSSVYIELGHESVFSSYVVQCGLGGVPLQRERSNMASMITPRFE